MAVKKIVKKKKKNEAQEAIAKISGVEELEIAATILQELAHRKGWGHSSIDQGFTFLQKSRTKSLAISHHSHYRNDKEMSKLDIYIKKRNVLNRTNVFLAQEGKELII